MAVQIGTSTSATVTRFGNQRQIDRTSNGVLWVAHPYASTSTNMSAELRYSTDNGATWSSPSYMPNGTGQAGGQSYQPNLSLFIDVDDYAHVIFKDHINGYIYYRRGTPNAGRTAWTWSAATEVGANTSYNYPDITAHREGTGWAVHFVSAYTSSYNYVFYGRITVSSSGTITISKSMGSDTFGGHYGLATWTFPSIDFHHTGDGKTIKDGTPHLYVAWSAGYSSNGIKFKKVTYSGGAWTYGTERTISSTEYVNAGEDWINSYFDGENFVIGGYFGSQTNNGGYIWQRDAADTTTTLLGTYGNSVVVQYGALTYDLDRNPYLIGLDFASNIVHRRYNRVTATTESAVTIVTPTSTTPYVSAKSGYSASRIEFIYRDGVNSPYPVKYESLILNAPPSTTITTADNTQFDPRLPFTVNWSYYDVEGSTQLQSQSSWRVAGGTWTDMPAQAGTSTSYTFAANTFPDESNVEARVRTHDGTSWGNWDTVPLRSDSWTYLTEIVGTTNTATIDTTGWTEGDYQVQVKTSDAVGYGPYGQDTTTASNTNVAVYLNGQWQNANRYVYYGGQWVRSNPVMA